MCNFIKKKKYIEEWGLIPPSTYNPDQLVPTFNKFYEQSRWCLCGRLLLAFKLKWQLQGKKKHDRSEQNPIARYAESKKESMLGNCITVYLLF